MKLNNSASPPRYDADLRERAQARMRGLDGAQGQLPNGWSKTDNPQRLLHELQVHQVELELQNEQLEAARAFIEAALATYTELYDHAPVPYFTFNCQGMVIDANLAGARLLGVERADLIDKRFQNYVAETDRGMFRTVLRRVFGELQQGGCELDLIGAEGRLVRIEIRPSLSEAGDVCRAVLVDIGERKLHEGRLTRMADAFIQASAPMFITGTDGCILEVNHALCTLCAYTPAQLQGQDAQWLCEDQGMDGRVALRTKNGGPLPMQALRDPVCDDAGEVVQWVVRLAASGLS